MTTILVVDDSAIDRRLTGGLLGKRPEWNVCYAAHGVDALTHLQTEKVDVVVTDLAMPEMDGLELVAAVRDRYPSLPVIVMTGKGTEEIAVMSLRQGAACYIPKRNLATGLLDAVVQVLAASPEAQSAVQLMEHRLATRSTFLLGNSLAVMPALINHLQQPLAELGICDQNGQRQVGVALQEAIKNAYEHGNMELGSELREASQDAYYALLQQRSHEVPYRDRKIYVDATFSHTEAVFQVRDEGPGFDPSRLPDPSDPEQIERGHCRGTILMRTFMDEVGYNETGNEVTMIKRKSTPS